MDTNKALEQKYWQLFWKTEVLMITQLSVKLDAWNCQAAGWVLSLSTKPQSRMWIFYIAEAVHRLSGIQIKQAYILP